MYQEIQQQLIKNPKTWLITGVAGFIGSNILEQLLSLNQKVVGIDNLITGKLENVHPYLSKFDFHQLDITDRAACTKVFASCSADYVLHQAAISSVQYSMLHPEAIKINNVDGFNNILELSDAHHAKALVYASSSAVYGDNSDSQKTEQNLGQLLSPYAASKYSNEKSAISYQSLHHMNTVGLRYFNVYGKNQDPNGTYAAVVPKWIDAVLSNNPLIINGDGSTTRDFCSVADIVQANILASHLNSGEPSIYNIGTGKSQSLNFLLQTIINVARQFGITYNLKPEHRDFVTGDIKHSCANIDLAKKHLNFYPGENLENGIAKLIDWHIAKRSITST